MAKAEAELTSPADASARELELLGRAARTASAALATASRAAKDRALRCAAERLRAARPRILEANADDMERARAKGLSAAMLDRLLLTPERIEAMAAGLEAIAGLDDPVGAEIARWTMPNGLDIARVRTPLGVIGVIYESRPNVTADAAGLCLKAGNAVILRGGSESFASSGAIVDALGEALDEAGLPRAAIQRVPTTDRAAVGHLLRMSEFVDVIVPRGGRALIERVREEARIPVFSHLDGVCHVYLHESAELEKAASITLDAKMRRTGICGSAETVLIDRAAAERLLPRVLDRLIEAGCEVRGCEATRAIDPRVVPAAANDFGMEFLAPILAVKVIDDLDAAIEHIAAFGSNHTDAIVAEDASAIEAFLARVDSAITIANASTQFADGGEFGMGAEIGIATGKMHARGPVGVEQLTSFKYQVRGSGQIRG